MLSMLYLASRIWFGQDVFGHVTELPELNVFWTLPPHLSPLGSRSLHFGPDTVMLTSIPFSYMRFGVQSNPSYSKSEPLHGPENFDRRGGFFVCNSLNSWFCFRIRRINSPSAMQNARRQRRSHAVVWSSVRVVPGRLDAGCLAMFHSALPRARTPEPIAPPIDHPIVCWIPSMAWVQSFRITGDRL